MVISPIKTPPITHESGPLEPLLDTILESWQEKSVLAITSKIVSLCEGSTVPASADIEELIRKEADFYLPPSASQYGHHFTIKNHTVVASAGIDDSNGAGRHVLWPRGAMGTAERIRNYLKRRFGVAHAGVIITDSTSVPFRLGTMGVVLGWSGFKPLNDYMGLPDVFGRQLQYSRAAVANGLAAAAVLAMGEGAEQTPLAVIKDAPFVQFVDRAPTLEELETISLTLKTDLFGPLFAQAPWEKGGSG